MTPRPFYFFISGINDDTTDVRGWDDRAKRLVNRTTASKADNFPYEVGPISRMFRQGANVRGALACLAECVGPDDEIVLVGHSNGCQIICEMLASDTIRARDVHLIGAACDADYEKNGLNAAVAKGRVGVVHVYCSPDDRALKVARATNWFMRRVKGLAYGWLGLTGPTNMSPEAAARTDVLPFAGLDHSDYFVGDNFDRVMRLVTGVKA